MAKVLILSASTGEGHNQAAKSLEAIYKSHGNEVIIIDFLKVSGKVVENIVLGVYSFLYKHMPYIYKVLYEHCNKNGLISIISNYAFIIFQKKILKKIMNEKPDLIIGTHAFTVKIVCMLKEKGYISIPFISVITDYKAHRFHLNSYVDAYITANEYTKIDMVKRGISKEKIYPYGIPIKQDFFIKTNSKSINDRPFTILLMGGSLGCNSIETVLKNIINCKYPLRIIVICGKNKALMKNISFKYSDRTENKEILLYGFTNDVHKLMKESNLLISKPGGLTVTEAIASNIPMLIPYMIPGQEEENAEFLVEFGAARIINEIEALVDEIDYIIENPKILLKMKNNMSTLYKRHSLEKIIKLSNDLININLVLDYSCEKRQMNRKFENEREMLT